MRLRRVVNPRGWTSLPNAMLEDEAISFRARGLLAYLLSRPANWDTDSVRLSRGTTEGRDAVRTALSELERAGYLHRPRTQGPGGRWGTDWLVADRPFDPDDDALIPADGL